MTYYPVVKIKKIKFERVVAGSHKNELDRK